MADFHQTGVITTLHRLGAPNLIRLERELVRYGRERPVALVLPSLYSELHGPALKQIVEELSQVPYLRQCVVSLSGDADVPSQAPAFESRRIPEILARDSRTSRTRTGRSDWCDSLRAGSHRP